MSNNGLGDMSDRDILIKVHTKVDYIEQELKDSARSMADMKDRLKNLESWRDKVNGSLALVGFLVTGTWIKILGWLK